MIRPIQNHFGLTDYIMSLVLADLTPEQARHRLRDGEGSSIVWILGHLLVYRARLVNQLGREREAPWEELFGEASAADGTDYPSLEELREAWSAVSADLDDILSTLPDTRLTEPTAGGGPHGERTLLDDVNFFMWHESYHMGALGIIRTLLGLPATSTLAMAAAERSQGT